MLTTPLPQERLSPGWTACLLGAAFLVLYLRTLCPTVYLGDSGEFCTAIATGGVPHPPGYPLFSLLGRLALWLIPVGEPAFRIGCVAALAAAAAIAILYLLSRELGCSSWAAAVGASVYGVSYTFWSQSTRVEVYSLHVLLLALVLLGALRYRQTGKLGDLATAAVAGTLGVAHHLTVVLLLPAVLLLCGRRLWRDPRPARRLGLLTALLPIGPALYLLLMLWARAEPLHAWGHTVTLPLLWNHASARIFRIFMAVPDGPSLARTMSTAGTLFIDNFPYLLFVLPMVGIALLWKRDRVAAGALLLTAAVIGAYNCCYRIDDIACYYLPIWLLGALFLAQTLDAAARLGLGAPMRSVIAVALAALLVGLPLRRNWSACDLSRATWMRDFARQKLESVASGGVLIVQGDDDTNPIWYVHDVLGTRPDVTPIDRAQIGGRTWGLYDWDPSVWYLHRLRRQGVAVPLQVPADPNMRMKLARDGCLIELLSRELHARSISMTSLPAQSELTHWVAGRYQPVPVGLVLRLFPKRQPVDLPNVLRENERLWKQITLPDLQAVRTDQEIAPYYIAGHYATMLTNFGGLHEKAGNITRATELYRRAADWSSQYSPTASAPHSPKSAAQERPRSTGTNG
jgi:hypothetical protein